MSQSLFPSSHKPSVGSFCPRVTISPIPQLSLPSSVSGTPRSWPAGTPAFRGAEPAAPQCPEPRRPHDPGASGDHTNAPRPTPYSFPGLQTSLLISGGAGGRHAEPRARSGAGGGRGAGERAPGLHMLTRAVRGQRPASAGS